MSLPAPYSPRDAAIQRLQNEIQQLTRQHSASLDVESFLGLTAQQRARDEQRLCQLMELVQQLEIFGRG